MHPLSEREVHGALAIGAPRQQILHGTTAWLIHARIDVAGFLRGRSLFSGVRRTSHPPEAQAKPSAVRVGDTSHLCSLLTVDCHEGNSHTYLVGHIIGILCCEGVVLFGATQEVHHIEDTN